MGSAALSPFVLNTGVIPGAGAAILQPWGNKHENESYYCKECQNTKTEKAWLPDDNTEKLSQYQLSSKSRYFVK